MHVLSDGDLLRAWDAGRERSLDERALAIIAAASPDTDPVELEAWSLGRRNESLLRIHGSTFGRALRAFATCPECAAPLELELDARDLEIDGGGPGEDVERDLATGGYRLRFRAIDSAAMTEAAQASDSPAAREVLLRHCVTECRKGDRPVAVSDLPETVLAALDRALETLDPGAERAIGLTCPDCGHRWELGFDPGAYLWTEIAAAARRILLEVDTLARAYGWTEAEILALGAARRAAYMDLAS